jgi:hypothetical protein
MVTKRCGLSRSWDEAASVMMSRAAPTRNSSSLSCESFDWANFKPLHRSQPDLLPKPVLFGTVASIINWYRHWTLPSHISYTKLLRLSLVSNNYWPVCSSYWLGMRGVRMREKPHQSKLSWAQMLSQSTPMRPDYLSQRYVLKPLG